MQVACIFIRTDSFCHRGKSQLFIHELAHGVYDTCIYSIPALSVLFFSIIERSVLMALVFHYKDMLEKVAMQRTQQFLASLCPTKRS